MFGKPVGASVGVLVGDEVVGATVGVPVGVAVGDEVLATVGAAVGVVVGDEILLAARDLVLLLPPARAKVAVTPTRGMLRMRALQANVRWRLLPLTT